MYRGKRIVIVTPAGRKRYLEILMRYVLKEKDIVDEYRLWLNTNNPTDIEYIESLASKYNGFLTVEKLADNKPDWHGNRRVRLICQFFKNCIDDNTIYIRLDDDICWMMPGAIRKLLDFRINHPEYFLVYPGIFNNGYTAMIHSQMGMIDIPDCSFRTWQRMPIFGILHHEKLIDALQYNTIDQFVFDKVVIEDYAQAAINCVSWFGNEFSKFDGVVADEQCDFLEEIWLTKIKPMSISKPNCMYGGSLVSHFAFNKQREYFENNTNLLQAYEVISIHDNSLQF